MRLTRFCSQEEFGKFMAGESLTNHTGHYRDGSGGSTSVGFCFSPDSPKTAWRYLKGIVNPEICIQIDIDERYLTKSRGRYVDYSKSSNSVYQTCYKEEYCAETYSLDTAKLVRVVPPEEFAAYLEEFEIAKVLYNIKTKKYE